jgi:hypothetical protein
MLELRNLQQEFLGHLLDTDTAGIVSQIESTPKRSAKERMTFYSYAYVARLIEALDTDYKRLHRYLGDDLFDTLARQYIDRYPSHGPNLRYFSQHMVDLVESLTPFSQYPEIGEIARIEQAFADSFDAADSALVSVEALSELDPEAWTTMTPIFHRAVQLLPQQHNSFQIWQALSDEDTPPEKVDDEATWIIWRQDLVSHYRGLDDAELAALKVAMSGGDFSDLCVALLSYFDEEQTPHQAVGFLQQWISDQMVSELRLRPAA